MIRGGPKNVDIQESETSEWAPGEYYEKIKVYMTQEIFLETGATNVKTTEQTSAEVATVVTRLWKKECCRFWNWLKWAKICTSRNCSAYSK